MPGSIMLVVISGGGATLTTGYWLVTLRVEYPHYTSLDPKPDQVFAVPTRQL